MFEKISSPSFDRILPDFEIGGVALDGVIDADRYAALLLDFGRKDDVFVFGRSGYDEARFAADRESYGDRSFREWSVAKIAPEHLIVHEMHRTPANVFSLCCQLASDLSKRIEGAGVREMAFIISMTPAGEGLDQDAYTFRLVTGREGVEEFAVIMGDQPQIVLVRGL